MIDRLVLQGLAAGVNAGDLAAAHAAIAHADWILRGFARRKLARVVDAAERETGERCGDPEATRHVLKAAALAIAGSFYVATKHDSVASEYDALPERGAPGWWVVTSSAMVALAAAGVAAVMLSRAPHVASAHEVHEAPAARAKPALPLAPPPSEDAFRTGGQPLSDDAITTVLREYLAPLVALVDHDRSSGEHSAARRGLTERLAASPAFAAHGQPLAKAWQAVLAALEHWVDLPTVGPEAEAGADRLYRAVNVLSDALIAANLGYYLEPTVIPDAAGVHGLVTTYRIENVSFVNADGTPRRVLALRRLDRLNYVRTKLGEQIAQHGGALLLLDPIEHSVAIQLLPVLGRGAPYALGEPEWAARPDHASLSLAAGDAVRREIARSLGDDAEAATKIGDLLGERAALLASMQDRLAKHGGFPIVETVLLTPDVLNSIRGKIPEPVRQRLIAIDAAITAADVPRIAVRVRQLLAATVRRHEVEHNVDADPGHPRRYPAMLAALAGPLADRAGRRSPILAAASDELSAYLSQIANDPATPQIGYWLVAEHAFAISSWGSPEMIAAVVASEALAHALHVPITTPLVHDDELDRDQLAVIARAIAVQSDDALRAAAATAWRDLFGAQVPRIVDLPPASTSADTSGNVPR